MISLLDFSEVIGIFFDPIPLIIIGFVISLFLFVKGQKILSYFFASTLIIAGILIKVLKEIFQKARPQNMLINEPGYAFPSGHATISLVFFFSLAYIISKNSPKKIKILYFILAILLSLITSFTRIYLNVHDYYDVLGGLILGTLILSISLFLFHKFIKD